MKTQIKDLMRMMLLLMLCLALTQCSTEQINQESDLSESTLTAKAFGKKRNELQFKFVTHLSGSNEVPTNDSKATGQAIVEISDDESMIYYKLIVANIDNVFASHFHFNSVGNNGMVVAGLFMGPKKEGHFGGILSEGYITSENVVGPLAGDMAALINAIREGNIYINVHTDQYRGGELRGQL